MDCRYQVFVSSTYEDLREERSEAIQALLALDCIPAGMEMFPASDDDAWTLVKGVIDDCDYYLVISAGRYGSVDSSGVSFTEREYDYAVSIGKPVLAFLHNDLGTLISARVDADDATRARLDTFRTKCRLKTVKHWATPKELGGLISQAIARTIKSHPAEGWVRGRFAAGPDTLQRMEGYRDHIAELERELATARLAAPEGAEELAQGEDSYEIVVIGGGYSDDKMTAGLKTSWDELFRIIGPLMLDEASEGALRKRLGEELYFEAVELDAFKDVQFFNERVVVDEDHFQTVKVQLRALGLMEKSDKRRAVSDKSTYWRLTARGDAHLVKLRAMRRGVAK